MSERTNEDGWINHDGKGMPVDADVGVRVKFRDGTIGSGIAGFCNGTCAGESNWIFSELGPQDDIIAYRVVAA